MGGIMMNDEFEIYGTHIPFSAIKNYRMVKREYIYRPAYKAKTTSLKSLFSNCKYEFYQMIPYAAIISDDEYTLATKNAKTNTVGESIIKDIAIGVISSVSSKLNTKELKYKKYKCENIAGRQFTTFLEDVPAVIIRDDGRVTDVYKNDELYKLLEDSTAPSVMMVPALEIIADTKYVFYGDGIQLTDVSSEYNRLRSSIETYKIEQHDNRLINKLPKKILPKLFDKSSKEDDKLALPDKHTED